MSAKARMTEEAAGTLERKRWGADVWVLSVSGAVITAWYLLTALAAPGGADASRYEDWARAFWSGDPFVLESNTFSPTGMPLSQWSHGPGLLAMPFVGLFDDKAVRVLGFVLTLCTTWFFVRILMLATRGSRRDALLLFAVALLGTHWGFYALVHSSESLSYFPLAGMIYWAASRDRYGASDAFVVGCLAYMLMLIRVQLAIYCIPVFAWMVWTVFEQLDFRSPSGWRRALVTLLALGGPPLSAVIQTGALYALMLGSSTASPYVFGDHGFSSFTLAKPELRAVLVHSWHGLLTYHPLYALAFCALVVLMASCRSWKQRVVLASLLLVMALHVLLQAAWYVWWLGTGTFGMRALGLWFIVAVPALAPLLRTRFRTSVVVALVLTCAWSYLLLIPTARPPVYSQFYRIRELLEGQLEAARYCYESGALNALLVAAATWLITQHADRTERGLQAVTNALLYLYAFYVIDLNTWEGSPFAELFGALRPALRLAAVPLVPLISAVWLRRDARPDASEHASTSARDRGLVLAAVSAAAFVFIATNLAFVAGMQRMASKRVPYDPSLYRYCSGVQIEEVAASYREYLQVPAFKGKKRALEDYLKRLDRRSCQLGSSRAP
jgi:hypothetical protein